jgi:hypothetical protein
LARQRINVWYADSSNLDDATSKSKDGVSFRLSKGDFACGGDGVPLSFVEWDIDDARPVDAFNIIVNSAEQPKWDSRCKKMTPLVEKQNIEARGFAGLFDASPISDRQEYVWQVAEANFTTEEFWIIFSTLQNDVLKQLKPSEPGSTELDNCLAAYKITKTDKGCHVVISQQPNAHAPAPFSARTAAQMGSTDSINWATTVSGLAKQQRREGWNATKTVLPGWMLQDMLCTPPKADVDMKEPILARAAQELHGTDPGQKQPEKKLPNGEMLQTWRRMAECAVPGCSKLLKSCTVPVWQARFRVPDAVPVEVFNVLVAKTREGEWNKLLQRVNVTGFQGGARGLHEMYGTIKVGPFTKMVHSREFWEWQAATHFASNDTYVVAFGPAQGGSVPKFDKKSVEASDCLAAYEVSPDPKGGTSVQMSSHVNPNLGIMTPLLDTFLPMAGMGPVEDFAKGLTEQARLTHRARGGAGAVAVDGAALALLSPPVPYGDGNQTVTLAEVLAAGETHDEHDWRHKFAALSLPTELDSAHWPRSDFSLRAAAVSNLFNQRLRDNATEQEAAAFADGPAKDAIDLQRQGEAMASIQYRFVHAFGVEDCNSALPDIDHHEKETGFSMTELIAVATAFVVALCLSCCGLYAGCRWKRRRRRRASSQMSRVSHMSSELIAAEQGHTRATSPSHESAESSGVVA